MIVDDIDTNMPAAWEHMFHITLCDEKWVRNVCSSHSVNEKCNIQNDGISREIWSVCESSTVKLYFCLSCGLSGAIAYQNSSK